MHSYNTLNCIQCRYFRSEAEFSIVPLEISEGFFYQNIKKTISEMKPITDAVADVNKLSRLNPILNSSHLTNLQQSLICTVLL